MLWSEDPISTLMDEHRLFLRWLADVRRDTLPFEVGTVRVLPAAILTFGEVLSRDVDELHGRKEEEGLFPALVRHLEGEEGPVRVMLEDHEVLRRHRNDFSVHLKKIQSDPEAPEARTGASRVIGSVDALLRSHIEREDGVLFPLARDLLSPAEIQEVAEVFREVEIRLGPISLLRGSSGPGPH